MSQQTLQTIVALSGRVDNSFGMIGEALIGMGQHLDALSGKIIGFGKESVQTFANYDDAMRETQAVGGYTVAEMEKLDALNREIARTTTYSNIDSANAMVLIAQAGLDVNEVYSLLPETLKLAMAGNLELADSADYLMTSLKSMGYGMDYADELTDQMAKTASIGMTDIDTIGDALMRLGSASGEFFTDSQEVLTILSAMSQFGKDMRGSQAGTWLRNFMLSLAAPSGSIEDIVDAMEQLGVAQEEIDEYAKDHSNGVAASAVQSLIDDGLKIYDEKGRLLPAIDIIKSLRDTVRGNAAYSEDLTELTGALNEAGGDIDAFINKADGLTDNAIYNIFSKIFGKRGITTAMNLISISDKEWEETMDEIVNSEGFAQGMVDTMQGGLGGALRELEASFTEFKTTIGENLAPDVQAVAGGLKDIVTSLSDMDEDTLDALVDGAAVLAAAGPGLILAGGAFRLIGYALTPAGGIGLGLTALTAAAAALKELKEADFADNFGDMNLDTESLTAYVQGLGEDFKASYKEVNAFSDALDKSVQSYKTASTEFSGKLLTTMLTGATLTEDDIATLNNLGGDMHEALIDGIHNSTASSMSYWELIFGGAGTAEKDADFKDIIDLTNENYERSLAEAEAIGQGLRDALTKAFEDSQISPDEYANIQGFMQSYNDAIAQAAAEAQSEADFVNMQMLLHKAQTASFDEVKAMAAEIEAERESVLADAEDTFLREYFKLQYRGADEQTLAAARGEYESHAATQSAKYDDILLKMWESTMQQSELADPYAMLGDFADRYLAGELSKSGASDLFGDLYGKSIYAGDSVFPWDNPIRQQVGEYVARMVSSLGGYDEIQDKIDEYTKSGDTGSAYQLARLLAMEGIATNYAWMNVTSDTPYGWFDGRVTGAAGFRSGEFDEQLGAFVSETSAEAARRTVEAFSGEGGGMDAMFDAIGSGLPQMFIDASNSMSAIAKGEFNNLVHSLSETYDFEKVLSGDTHPFAKEGTRHRDEYAAYSLMYGKASENPEQYAIQAQIEPVITPGAVEAALGDTTSAPIAQAQIEPVVAPGAVEAALGDSAVVLEVDGDTTLLSAKIDEEDRKPLLEYVDGDTGALHTAIWEEDGQTITTFVNGNVSGLRNAIKSLDGMSISVNVRGSVSGVSGGSSGSSGSKKSGGSTLTNAVKSVASKISKYAEGGRADEPSIFGEAGPEWAIPEEHTQRVANLFDLAREAAGFTWPELLARNGGLNAGGVAQTQLVYAPTINANDARGVEQKLIEDKARLERWWQERRMRDEMEVYA